MSDPVETSELLAFTATVDAKSLSRAASHLRVPRATISRRLARLEQRLGRRLIRRTTRSLALTDAGVAFYRHARIVLDAVRLAEESMRIGSAEVCGNLRVSVPPWQDDAFLQFLCDFAERHPRVRLQVHFSTRRADLAGGAYDVALRAGSTIEPGLVARTLMRIPVFAVASPAYLAKHGTPRTARDLADHRCLMAFAGGEVPETHWPAGRSRVQVEGALFTNELRLLCTAALRGLGIAFLPVHLLGPLLDAGTLVQVLPGVVQADSVLAVVYAERELMPPALRVFVDAIVAWTAQNLPDLPRRMALRQPEFVKRRVRRKKT